MGLGISPGIADQHFLFAAVVITRIISMPDERKLCLDLGYKSIASENGLNDRVHFLNATDLEMVSHSEEHLVVQAQWGIPGKWGICCMRCQFIYVLPVRYMKLL
jgi:hypothetical protein